MNIVIKPDDNFYANFIDDGNEVNVYRYSANKVIKIFKNDYINCCLKTNPNWLSVMAEFLEFQIRIGLDYKHFLFPLDLAYEDGKVKGFTSTYSDGIKLSSQPFDDLEQLIEAGKNIYPEFNQLIYFDNLVPWDFVPVNIIYNQGFKCVDTTRFYRPPENNSDKSNLRIYNGLFLRLPNVKRVVNATNLYQADNSLNQDVKEILDQAFSKFSLPFHEVGEQIIDRTGETSLEKIYQKLAPKT